MEHFKLVEGAFDDEVDRLFKSKPDIHSFIKNHERRPKLMENLKSQVFETQLKNPKLLSQATLKAIGKEFAKTFSTLCIRYAEQQALSEAEKRRRIHEEHHFNEIQEELEKSAVGFTEELENGQVNRTEN